MSKRSLPKISDQETLERYLIMLEDLEELNKPSKKDLERIVELNNLIKEYESKYLNT